MASLWLDPLQALQMFRVQARRLGRLFNAPALRLAQLAKLNREIVSGRHPRTVSRGLVDGVREPVTMHEASTSRTPRLGHRGAVTAGDPDVDNS